MITNLKNKGFALLQEEFGDLNIFEKKEEVPQKVLDTYCDKYKHGLFNRKDIFSISLDQSQYTESGKALMYFYNYDTELEMRSGYPANGGSNTLSITDTKENIFEWLELLYERIPEKYHFFIDNIKEHINITRDDINITKLPRCKHLEDIKLGEDNGKI